MNIILIIMGLIGVFISVFMLFAGAIQLAKKISAGGCSYYHIENSHGFGMAMTAGIWQFNTLPVLSTISIFIFKHWIFIIPILFAIINIIVGLSIPKDKLYTQDLWENTIFRLFQKIYSFFGGVIIILGAPAILTLTVTSQKANNPTIFSWYFPLFILIISICAYISYVIIGMVVFKISKIFL